MMCPVCKRDLAPTLSICLTCGAMIHDTVREELETKISKTVPAQIKKPSVDLNPPRMFAAPKPVNETPIATPVTHEPKVAVPAIHEPKVAAPSIHEPKLAAPVMTSPPVVAPKISAPPTPTPTPAAPAPSASAIETHRIETPKIETPNVDAPKITPAQPTPTPAAKPIAARFDTGNLGGKKTSPTLVEFQTKKATVPEWRLQLQNTVRQKVGGNRRVDSTRDETQSAPRATNGANALKVEFIEEEQPQHQNPRVANALKRIEQSRRTFSNHPIHEQPVNVGGKPAPRSYPFNVVARSNETAAVQRAGQKATVNASPKPILVSPLKIEKKRYDTNKLPPLAKPAKQVEVPLFDDVPTAEEAARERWELLNVDEPIVEDVRAADTDPDQIEDLAPFSMRFAAGTFDLIVGVFAGFILLSPFILSGGDWFTLSGGLAVLASIAIVMFLYLTLSIAFVGRTLGMKLFSLELVDIEENAYPTLHQAAVNSAVYLFSLALAGLGFLPAFFNEERRAAHDILSGTILVREY